MSNSFSFELLETVPIIGILRGFTVEQVREIVAAAIRGGLKNLEITMDSPHAPDAIRAAMEVADGRMNIGAGTVTTITLLNEALAYGANFIVTPTVNEEILTTCVSQKIPIFPGAFSPTEIFRAWELGATMVKLFPADSTGPAYARALQGPFPQIKLLPTGGINLDTLEAFQSAGAAGFGIGSPIFDRQKILDGDWNAIEIRCRAFADRASRRKTDAQFHR